MFLLPLSRAKNQNILHCPRGSSGICDVLGSNLHLEWVQRESIKPKVHQETAEIFPSRIKLRGYSKACRTTEEMQRVAGTTEVGDKEHLKSPCDISGRKPLLSVSLLFYVHFGSFLTSKPQG